MSWFIERANKAIAVSAASDPARSLVSAALQNLRPRATSVKVATTLNVSGSEGNWLLRDQDTDRTWTIASSGGLIYQLTDRLMSGLAKVIETQHCLHAAAVSINGNAIVMPAVSGSGKSSLAMWLVANGFDYILSGAYWITFFPGIMLLVTVAAINIFGDHLRVLLNPRISND